MTLRGPPKPLGRLTLLAPAVPLRPFARPDHRRAAEARPTSGSLDEIAYGTVVMVLQDGRVIQIETSEKIRLR